MMSLHDEEEPAGKAFRKGFTDEARITQEELKDTSRMENESRNRSSVGQEDLRI
ncbi:hypothetical protein ACG1VR_03870 [Cedecea davisae]|uniref:hypothetical protein n=1 Tax=Cedecea davisae TaxID=158484 RepID=UPI001428AF02|nr:hypothetical protein [Cedecea davisae]